MKWMDSLKIQITPLPEREIDDLNRPVSIKENESVVTVLKNKAPGPDDFTGKYSKQLGRIYTNFPFLFLKIEAAVILLHSVLETSIAPTANQKNSLQEQEV